MTRKKMVYVVTLSAIAFFVAVNLLVEILRAASGA